MTHGCLKDLAARLGCKTWLQDLAARLGCKTWLFENWLFEN
jgi:hypothetical protein